ncbi:MAG: YciI family protein [Beijerinckiaceae bacterium]|jgi:uncharacterized protein YciI|nr:YciI family protein [Beijerinckiaceae bacterium]
MHWLMICRHHPGKEAERAAIRDRHRAHVLSGGGRVRVLIGSALTADDGQSPLGNFGVIEARSREDVIAFAEADPYAQAGIVADIAVTALATTFQAHRIDPMTPVTAASG